MDLLGKNKYLPHVDGLRAIAVIIVLLFHLDVKLFSGGYVGVDIFFVISGFLITGILKNELDSTRTIDLMNFFVRRFRRLAPALLVVTAFTFIFASLLFSPGSFQRVGSALTSTLLIGSNVLFWLEADYFDTSSKLKPLLHTWSLSVEWQFYIVLPLVMYYLYKKSLQKFLLPTILFFAFLSLLFNFIFSNGASSLNKLFPFLPAAMSDGKNTIFFGSVFRVFEFCIGAFILWVPALKINNKYGYDFLLGLGFILISISVFYFDDSMLFPYWYALIPCFGCALIIYSGGKSNFEKVLTNKIMVKVGELSYSIYLVHWPIIVFYKDIRAPFDTEHKVGIALVTVVFAFLLNKYVEKPMRFQQSESLFKSLRWKGVLLSYFLLLSLGLHSYFYDGWGWRKADSVVNIDESKSTLAFHREYYGGAGYPYYGPVKKDSTADIVILGDSHGRHYAEGVYKSIAEPNDLTLYIASGTSCFHLPGFTRTSHGVDWDSLCPSRLEKGLSFINSTEKSPLVIISHAWFSQMNQADLINASGERLGVDMSIDEITSGLASLKKHIGDSRLIVIGNVPGAGVNLYDVFTRPKTYYINGFNQEEYIYRDRDEKLVEINNALKKFSLESGLFTFFDPFDYLCDKEKCQNLDDENRLIYSDSGHLSKYGSIYLINKIKGEISSTW